MGLSPFFFGANKIMLNKRADKLELLRIAEAVALEKSIDKELIISSMETGIAKAAKSKFGQENEIKVSINRWNYSRSRIACCSCGKIVFIKDIITSSF